MSVGRQPRESASAGIGRGALQRSGTSPEELAERSLEGELEEESRRALRCRACGATVTSESEWISVDGKRVHRRVNPYGFEFEFGCFRQAPGARREGSPTAEHTWFPGFAWVLSLCGTCGAHLGWHFEGAGPPFHALILAALVGGGIDE